MASSSSASLISGASFATSSSSTSSSTSTSSSCSSSPSSGAHWASRSTLNPKLLNAQYAVRGGILLEAQKIEHALQAAHQRGVASPFAFDQVIYCNIGNPQQLGQKPISFHRQVLSIIEFPYLIENAETRAWFPADVVARAEKYLHIEPRGTGPYAHSQGMSVVREEIARFIDERDRTNDCNANHIFLTNGASAGVDLLFRAFITGPNDGIMVPIPQYPLYSATIPMLGGTLIKYYLNESDNWGLAEQDLSDSLSTVDQSVIPRALVVINPGNPTGQCLKRSHMEQIIRFCHRHKLMLLADEVYQENIYFKDEYPFESFRKVLKSMGSEYQDLQLISFHSTSKGFLGECGKRGGYFEMIGFDDEIMSEIYKAMSISLCSNVTGQIMTGLMVNPPKAGDVSYAKYVQERDEILASLKRRAAKLVSALNSLEGVSCNAPTGAMYAFPQITLPTAAQEAARQLGVAADYYYCLELLRNTGLCVVPGSGFGQRDGTFHFRTTFLPLEEHIDSVIVLLKDFHSQFLKQFGGAK